MEVQVLSCAFGHGARWHPELARVLARVNSFLPKIIPCGKIGSMNVIHTNRDQRPAKYSLEATDVADKIGNGITKGRVRQIGRGFNNCGPPLGWMQFKLTAPDDGKFQFPFAAGHKYSQEDVARVVEFVENCRAAGDLRYALKLNRWYCEKDLVEITNRSKRLLKNANGGVMPNKKKPAAKTAASARPVKSAKTKVKIKA